jgi:hypothetical protein
MIHIFFGFGWDLGCVVFSFGEVIIRVIMMLVQCLREKMWAFVRTPRLSRIPISERGCILLNWDFFLLIMWPWGASKTKKQIL